MFIGHYGAGLSLKKAAPPVSLGLLFIAVQFLDLLWPTMLLLHIEHVQITTDKSQPIPLIFTDYPWSHSLVMALVWSAVFFVLYWLARKDLRNAFVLGVAVFSHWLLDLIVHLPDLPLYPGSSIKLGLQLWRYPIAANLVEGVVFFTGMFLYLRATKAKNRTGVVVFWTLIALLLISHIANLFSPPPPSVSAIAWAGQAMWLFVLLGFWADKNRMAR
ncbi:MAG: metal-dependent hydrolase [Flavisolibacter sp.]